MKASQLPACSIFCLARPSFLIDRASGVPSVKCLVTRVHFASGGFSRYGLHSVYYLLLVSRCLFRYGPSVRMRSTTNSILTVLYFTRTRWLHLLPSSISNFSLEELPFRQYFYSPLPSSFSNDIESGLTSEDFDLHANLAGGDSRSGLDDNAKREILKIMKGSWIKGPVSFDEARRIYMERMLERQGIGRDGRPRDPKFVSFS